MHKYFWAGFLATVILFTNLYIRSHVYPKTFLGGLNVSGQTRQSLAAILTDLATRDIKITVADRLYTHSYTDLGISVQPELAVAEAFSPNLIPFPGYLVAYAQALFAPRQLRPPIEFTREYFSLIQSRIYDLSPDPDAILIDTDKQAFIFDNKSQRHILDEDSLRVQLLANFGHKSAVMTPNIIRLPSPQKEELIRYNEQLSQIWATPVVVNVAGGKKPAAFALTGDELKRLLTITPPSPESEAAVGVDQKKLAKLVDEKLIRLPVPKQQSLPLPVIHTSLEKIVKHRFWGTPATNTLNIALEKRKANSPQVLGATDGRRIEVDLKAQRMYLYVGENVHKTYRISSGKEYQTPTGKFTILNKVSLAYSNIYNVWMPYWMGFTYRADVNATLGIHELPYVMTADGRQISRPREVIGSPYTGGCIALDVGAAHEVFQFADLGTPLTIYN